MEPWWRGIAVTFIWLDVVLSFYLQMKNYVENKDK